jgi:hypothetical protein
LKGNTDVEDFSGRLHGAVENNAPTPAPTHEDIIDRSFRERIASGMTVQDALARRTMELEDHAKGTAAVAEQHWSGLAGATTLGPDPETGYPSAIQKGQIDMYVKAADMRDARTLNPATGAHHQTPEQKAAIAEVATYLRANSKPAQADELIAAATRSDVVLKSLLAYARASAAYHNRTRP